MALLGIRARSLSFLLFPNKWPSCHKRVRLICAPWECCLALLGTVVGPHKATHSAMFVRRAVRRAQARAETKVLFCSCWGVADACSPLWGCPELWGREIPILGSLLMHKSSIENAVSLSPSNIFLQTGSAIFYSSCKLPVEDRFLT